MAIITGTNNPGNSVHVDGFGRAEAHSVSLTEQSDSSKRGDGFNVNTGNITLTDATETPLVYLENLGEERDLIIERVFYAFGSSTGGSGDAFGNITANPTGGTIITAGTAFLPSNFNFGSGKNISVILNKGATGSTVTGGIEAIPFLFPTVQTRQLIAFDSIVLPRGSSLAISFTPPVGNTNITVQAGLNLYLAEPVS